MDGFAQGSGTVLVRPGQSVRPAGPGDGPLHPGAVDPPGIAADGCGGPPARRSGPRRWTKDCRRILKAAACAPGAPVPAGLIGKQRAGWPSGGLLHRRRSGCGRTFCRLPQGTPAAFHASGRSAARARRPAAALGVHCCPPACPNLAGSCSFRQAVSSLH